MTGEEVLATNVFRCGHPRTAENTKSVRNGTGTACLVCHRKLDRKYRADRRAREGAAA